MNLNLRGNREAFGKPGIEPRWTSGRKDGVGTAYSTSSRIWFTIWNGIVTEVYFPTVDRPQLRDLQFLITDGGSFFHEEKRHLKSETSIVSCHAPGFRIKNCDPDGRYTIEKEVIADPHLPCLLQHISIEGDKTFLASMRLYVLCAPHLEIGGAQNNAYVCAVSDRQILVAQKNSTWMALGATIPFARLSCGYVGQSDGWTDIASNYTMDWEFDQATGGNVALTGEIIAPGTREFTLGLAFGDTFHNAVSTLFQSIGIPFDNLFDRYTEQWERPHKKILPLEKASCDEGKLYRSSYSILVAHEDKSYPGALIASLSIPWGDAKGDEDLGGYHLVWTRDMVQGATGFLAAGDKETALRVLIYLAVTQQEDGGFPQNFWIDGEPYWRGIQLDEVSFPILLAFRLHRENALLDFDPYAMVMKAARYIVQHGPATQQERWEEAGGYSPSTLACNIAALIAAAWFAREHGDTAAAQYLAEYADFLECHIEPWTVTEKGSLVPAIRRHFIRINPVDINDPAANENPDSKMLAIANRPPGGPWQFPAREIVDHGFLELVRFGIRSPNDPLIVDSLKVIDSILKIETPVGPCWHRYNEDGYGQQESGNSFQRWGKGRAWPLLTAERGMYELAAGHDTRPFIRAMEGFASTTGLLPEQIWDEADQPKSYLRLGEPTASAMPLMWAHAEYLKLLRSVVDGKVFDFIPEVADHFGPRKTRLSLEIWQPNRHPSFVYPAMTLRIQAPSSFQLRWTNDEWQTTGHAISTETPLGISFIDIPILKAQRAPIRFGFFWTASGRQEDRIYTVDVITGKHP
jgi:glucoamylase